MAFSQTATAAAHAISYPLTLNYKIDHGLAVGILLGDVIIYNKDAIINLDEFLDAFNASNVSEVKQIIKNIAKVILDLNLSTFAITKLDIPNIALLAFNKARMGNNPKPMDVKDVENILLNNLN
jgi:alcohol dehydrogenase class IV